MNPEHESTSEVSRGQALRAARLEESRAVVDCLALAFRDNPMNRAVIGPSPDRRLEANRAGMRATMGRALELCDVRVVARTGRIEGALIAIPPGLHPLPPPGLLEQLRCLWGQGPRVARLWAEVNEGLGETHPVEPHWYLALLGIDPTRQGLGLGRALLSHWLASVDAGGWGEDEAAAGSMGVYLETDRRTNVAFYQHEGFEVVGEVVLLGVDVWRLWRPAGGGG